MNPEFQNILEVKDLSQCYFLERGWFETMHVTRAVNNVSFFLKKGETLGIVGESGCGKSTLLRSILQLKKPTVGSVFFQGQDLTKLTLKQLLPLRKNLQMIFQDPYSSLDPRMTIEESISEPLWIYKRWRLLEISKSEIQSRVKFLLDKVNLLDLYTNRYPHELSGGQRQRVGIARALALNPCVILADEPVSALDVSIQSQILNLLKDIQKEFSLSCIFVSHDLAVVKYISDRIIVMYLGYIVEIASPEELYKNPIHPYTKNLLKAIPIPDPQIAFSKKQKEVLSPNSFLMNKSMQKNFDKNETSILKEVSSGHFVTASYSE